MIYKILLVIKIYKIKKIMIIKLIQIKIIWNNSKIMKEIIKQQKKSRNKKKTIKH